MESDPCPFCERIRAGELTASTDLVVAFPDSFPLSPGHTLVVPRRHESDFFALSSDELAELMTLAVDLHRSLSEALGIEGMNLGVNAGVTAGQTIAHAHLHLIPRYEGDVPDAAGGIRWLFPERARYWEGNTPDRSI